MAERPRVPPDLRGVADLLTVGGYRLGALAARVTPTVLAAGLATPFGAGASLASPERRRMIARQLTRVDPTLGGLRLRRAVQQAFDHYARYWIESFQLPSLSRRTVERGIRTEGYEQVVDALDEGSGCILAMPHLGGWEWAGRWVADKGLPITVVVEKVEPPELFDWFVRLRSDLGMNVVSLGADAGKEVVAALRRNEIVCLLCDRDIQRNGPSVEFFGERTTLPAGVATMALRIGAPVFPTAVYFSDRVDGHFGWVRPPLVVERSGARLRDDVARVTQDIARELEVLIRRAPTQWHMFQPNWPSDPGYHDHPAEG